MKRRNGANEGGEVDLMKEEKQIQRRRRRRRDGDSRGQSASMDKLSWMNCALTFVALRIISCFVSISRDY